MNAVAIIPARYASTRFPGKPLIDIAGKSMIQRVYEGVKAVAVLQDVIVATDDERIQNHVLSFGGNVKMTSSDHRSGTERCAEVISGMASPPDIVINVQGDVPFIAEEHIHEILQCFQDKKTQIATLIKHIQDADTLYNASIPKVIFKKNMDAIYFSRSPIPHLRDIPRDKWHTSFPYYKHIGIYAYRSNVLKKLVTLPVGKLELAEHLEQLRWLEHGYTIRLTETKTESIAIDTPTDITLALDSVGK